MIFKITVPLTLPTIVIFLIGVYLFPGFTGGVLCGLVLYGVTFSLLIWKLNKLLKNHKVKS